MVHDLFEYVSSQMTFEVTMYAEMKSRQPDNPFADGKHTLRHCKRINPAKMMDWCSSRTSITR